MKKLFKTLKDDSKQGWHFWIIIAPGETKRADLIWNNKMEFCVDTKHEMFITPG